MVAGAFAFMPVEQASTVHQSTATLEDQTKLVALTATMNNNLAAENVATWTIGAPFCVESISFVTDIDAGGDLNLSATIATNIALATDNVLSNPGVIAVAATSGELLLNTDTDSPKVCGTTDLVFDTTVDAGGVDADETTVTILITVQADLTTPAAVLS